MPVTPVGVRLNFDLTVDDIPKLTDALMKKTQEVYDGIADLAKEDVNYENIVMALGNYECDASLEQNNLDFLQHVSTDKTIREASTEADKKLSEFDVEMSMRKDVFENLVAFQNKKPDLKAESQRFLERCIRDGKRNGLHLDDEKINEIKQIKKKCSELSIKFNQNCNEEKTILTFTAEELAGLPDDFTSSLEKDETTGKLKVSLQYPHYFPCQKKALKPETRRKLQTAFDSRCKEENTLILEELVELRHKKAQILGYQTHADFITEMRMSKKPDTVKKFLSDLQKKLAPLGDADLAIMRKMKSDDYEKTNNGEKCPDDSIRYWDRMYYMNKIEEQMYSVDHEALKEYFPMSVVTEGLLKIYQELLGLEFSQISDAAAWHPDVTMYSVTDSKSHSLIGYFYLDLFPREGKFGHAACFGLQSGCLKKDGSRQVAVAAMVANFTKPTEDKPSLLTHDEVETFFHEFGHVMHQICAEAEFARFSGTHVERDFVEAPSQMLENWCWEKKALRRMSKHYKDGSELPDVLIDSLIKSRKANAGVFNLRQILLATFDQRIHTSAKADTAEVFSKTSSEILKIPTTEGTNMSAAFGHLAGGYDAQYYGYMWSEVYSMDMFAARFKEDIFSKEAGMMYRNCILKPGGSKDAIDMVTEFLGRSPNDKAFLVSKGLDEKSAN